MQISEKAGIKKFGERVVKAMVKYYRQIDKGTTERNTVITPIEPEMLSYEDKMKALEAVNLIKYKRNGKIKGRTCADGSKQKNT